MESHAEREESISGSKCFEQISLEVAMSKREESCSKWLFRFVLVKGVETVRFVC